jgi:hypothetical protein
MYIGRYKRTVKVEPIRSPVPRKEEPRREGDRPQPEIARPKNRG